MIDNTVAAIIGTIIGSVFNAAGNIVVALIQSEKGHAETNKGFLVPSRTMIQRPSKTQLGL